MAGNYKMVAALSLMALLSACGKSGAPEKEEVKSLVVQQVFNQLVAESAIPGMFSGSHPMNDTQKSQLMDKLNKNVDIQSLNCKAAQGLAKIYDCQVLMSANQVVKNFPLHLVRKDDGTLAILDDAPTGSNE